MKCPNCGLINPPEAQLCDCSFDFETGQIRPSPPSISAQLELKPLTPQERALQEYADLRKHRGDPESLISYAIGRSLDAPGGCFFTPLYLAILIAAWHYAVKIADLRLEMSPLWMVVFGLTYIALCLAAFFPLSWLQGRIFGDRED